MATPLTINLSINGRKPQPVFVADSTEPLLYVLRNQFGLYGPKYGCGVAQCGACTVHVNGAITRSCVTRMRALSDGTQITTLEGLTHSEENDRDGFQSAATASPDRTDFGRALQRAFVDQQAAQCGYCANGMIMGAAAWLQSRIDAGNATVPSDDEVKAFLSGESQGTTFVYLCRCGTHLRIIRAIQQAAQEKH
jgi:aerobic-type carbon monoxide dehydrogenase small subunit (CoxS/CutS family)